ncbi:MAG: 30S ribosomal protein S27e [Candidatus Nanohaloarchaea archaeon]|nr:30S ribosomal protein S27e [Candidatus Nanohaloarchaea archaeon]
MVRRNSPDSNFIEVKCPECGNEQTVFDKPAEDVNCLVCEEPLIEATGGRGDVQGELLQEVA